MQQHNYFAMSDGEASAKLSDLKPTESGLQAPLGADFRSPAGVISNDVSLEELTLTDENGVARGKLAAHCSWPSVRSYCSWRRSTGG